MEKVDFGFFGGRKWGILGWKKGGFGSFWVERGEAFIFGLNLEGFGVFGGGFLGGYR